MKPEDFGASMLDQAHRLYRHAKRTRLKGLSPDTDSWLVRHDQRDRLLSELDAMGWTIVDQRKRGIFTLYQLPVRFTVDDDPATPELQLVTELFGP